MKYIAHKEQEREQTIKEHLCGTAQLAGEFAEKFGKGEWGYCCGKMHDIGKYSQEFQEKIKKNYFSYITSTAPQNSFAFSVL